jgi:hypothetical protein
MIRALASLTLSLAVVLPVMAHEAPTGWRYGWECCSNQDCRQLAGSEVEEGPVGYRIRLTGEIIPYSDARIKLSKDEFFHQCTPGGVIDAIRSICLYVPDRGY